MAMNAGLENILEQFIEAEVEAFYGHFEKSTNIHERFLKWDETQGYIPWTQRLLISELRGRGFVNGRGSGGVRGLRGLRLKPLRESEGTKHG